MKIKQLESMMEVEEVEEETEVVIKLPKPHGYFGKGQSLHRYPYLSNDRFYCRLEAHHGR
jgi:hypothetical protein